MPIGSTAVRAQVPAGNGHGGPQGRVLEQRRQLVNGRAALGGFLVAVAILLLFSIAHRSADAQTERYVVARHSLAIGTTLRSADLTTATGHIALGRLRTRLFARPVTLVGAVVIAPVGRGELIQASAVITGPAASQRQISVPIESARALGDRLQPGELVDVVATFGTGADAFSVTVVSAARVVAVDTSGGPLSDRKGEVVVLAVTSAEDGVAVAHAIAAGQLSLVRVSATSASDEPAPPYRAPRPAR